MKTSPKIAPATLTQRETQLILEIDEKLRRLETKHTATGVKSMSHNRCENQGGDASHAIHDTHRKIAEVSL